MEMQINTLVPPKMATKKKKSKETSQYMWGNCKLTHYWLGMQNGADDMEKFGGSAKI